MHILVCCRIGRFAEVCPTIPELHQQSKGSTIGALSARHVLGYGGSYWSGGGVVFGVH